MMVTQINFHSSRLLHPAQSKFIRLTLLISFILNLLPTSFWWWFPDWLLLVILFWSIRSPQTVATGTAFLFGNCMDIADSSLMGQHALAYVCISYIGKIMAHRILWLPLGRQLVSVFPVIFSGACLQAIARWLVEDSLPSAYYFVQPVMTTLLWVPATYILMLPQFLSNEIDYERPI